MTSVPFVDIHCHLIPGIDDGAKSWRESLAMAEMAVGDGIRTIIATPHQLGAFAHNEGDMIRQQTDELQQLLRKRQIPLEVLAGADVRVDEGLFEGLRTGQVVSLANQGKHVLLELPHELYFRLETVLDGLAATQMVGILSHPERNQGLLKQPEVVEELVEYGCLMQITAGSLMGTFGPQCEQMSCWMLEQGLVHFVATDAHGPRARRPLISRAFQRVANLVGSDTALDLCCHNPAAVAAGLDIETVRRRPSRSGFAGWFEWRKAG